MEATYKVYVLRNSTGKFYIGVSEDVTVRMVQHNAGISKWTAKFVPWSLVWTSDRMTLQQARKLENWLKRQKGGNGFFAHTGIPRPTSDS